MLCGCYCFTLSPITCIALKCTAGDEFSAPWAKLTIHGLNPDLVWASAFPHDMDRLHVVNHRIRGVENGGASEGARVCIIQGDESPLPPSHAVRLDSGTVSCARVIDSLRGALGRVMRWMRVAHSKVCSHDTSVRG